MSASLTDDGKKPRSELGLLEERSPELAKELFAFIETHTLDQAQEFLATDPRFKIGLSTTAISNWATRKRSEARDVKFQSYLATLAENAQQSRAIVSQVAGTEENSSDLVRANVVALNAALLQAIQSGNIGDIKRAVKLCAMITEAGAKESAAKAALLSAGTAEKRFRFDAAKSALEHAEELQRINASTGSQREKIERAMVAVFGRHPTQAGGTPSLAGGSLEPGRVPPDPSNVDGSKDSNIQDGHVGDTNFIKRRTNIAGVGVTQPIEPANNANGGGSKS